MIDLALLGKAIESTLKVANTAFVTTVIDKLTGFRISKWAAEGEVIKKLIHDEYEKAKEGGITGMQYIKYMRNMTNLLNTAVKSSKHIEPDKTNEIKMDNDFFWNTIEHSKTVSNDDMQELIAKIIAGEYNKPGTYSMITLQILKMLGKSELELFEKMCSLCINDGEIPQNIFSLPESIKPVLNLLGVDFGNFQTLQSLGLFLPNSMTPSVKKPNQKFGLKYFDQYVKFESEEKQFDIEMPNFYGLSISGKQIIKHLNPKFIDEYFEWLKINYKVKNYKVIDGN